MGLGVSCMTKLSLNTITKIPSILMFYTFSINRMCVGLSSTLDFNLLQFIDENISSSGVSVV